MAKSRNTAAGRIVSVMVRALFPCSKCDGETPELVMAETSYDSETRVATIRGPAKLTEGQVVVCRACFDRADKVEIDEIKKRNPKNWKLTE